MATLTAKGQPLTAVQESVAQQLISVGKGLNAPTVALQACVFDAIFESDLGLNNGWTASNPTYGGVLAGNVKYFGQYGAANSPNVLNAEAGSFYQGGRGYQAGGAIAAAGTYSDPSILGPQITQPDPITPGNPYGQYLSQGGISLIRQVKAEAIAIVAAYRGGGLSGGGVYGLGGTGTPANSVPASLWRVGNAYDPDQDYWTCMNQYAQNAQMYLFSDGETLYLADGIKLMGQTPAAVIFRTDRSIISADLTYDNTSFQSTHTHIRKGKIQRRAALARTTSPTEVEVKIICNIDKFRGGDVVYLKMFGPADGLWLVGERRRSLFAPYSTLTLVQAMQPNDVLSGLPYGPAYLRGKGASAPGSGTVIANMLSEAATINNRHLPYEWGGGHTQAGAPDAGKPGDVHVGGYGTVGFDCSGAVAAVLAAGGLWQEGSSVPSSNQIVDTLISKGGILAPGSGSGKPECTLFDSPDHIFMRLNGEFWGTADGVGNIPSGSSGGGWIPNGSAGSGFRATHVLPSVLGQQPAQTLSSANGG